MASCGCSGPPEAKRSTKAQEKAPRPATLGGNPEALTAWTPESPPAEGAALGPPAGASLARLEGEDAVRWVPQRVASSHPERIGQAENRLSAAALPIKPTDRIS